MLYYRPLTSVYFNEETSFYTSTLQVAAMIRKENWKITNQPKRPRFATSLTEVTKKSLRYWFPEKTRLYWEKLGFYNYLSCDLTKREGNGKSWYIDKNLADLIEGKYDQDDLLKMATIQVEYLEEDLKHAKDALARVRKVV